MTKKELFELLKDIPDDYEIYASDQDTWFYIDDFCVSYTEKVIGLCSNASSISGVPSLEFKHD